MPQENGFSYTYSAAQQQEVESIRKKYQPQEEDKLERLRKLHRASGQAAQAWAIAFGVIGALLLGTGMSLVMTELGAVLGNLALAIGVVLGVLGIFLVALAYPVYNRVLMRQRQRNAPEILRLADELLK